MKKQHSRQTVTVDVRAMSHDGRGIATIDNKTTFIDQAIRGEKLTCRVYKKHSRYNEAEAVDILQPAAERIQPRCAHFGTCGGCTLQHIEPSAQLVFKQAMLLEQLQHFGKVTPKTILPPLTGEAWHYRRKARLGVRYMETLHKVVVGFRERNSNSLVDIIECPILHETIGTRIADLSKLIATLSQYKHIPQIEVAVSDHETVLVFRHLKPFSQDDIQKLKAFAAMHQFHIYLQPNSPEKISKIWPENSSDILTYRLADFQLDMQFYPWDFVQINSEMNQLLLKQTLQLLALEKTDTVLDLFCGLGNFTLPIARYAKHVVGIEGSSDMTARAEQNARLNHIDNTEFHAANLMAPSANAPWLQQKYTKILLDPPRTGAKEILPYLSAPRIVYVSCNPATLARDAGELVHKYHYKLHQVGIINMFPHTGHVESIALFEK